MAREDELGESTLNEAMETTDHQSDEEDRDIQELLDIGYEQLDGFVSWLEATLGMDTRTAQQDCFNAESLLDYLANYARKTAIDVNEFELRWFLFNHYIRKAMADAETELRLPDSLRRFFLYLEEEHGYTQPDWLYQVLDDRDYYIKRRQEYADLDLVNEQRWQEGFRAWCAELEEDLDTRCLWLPRDLGDGMAWGDVMGWREATLQEEANRIWQEERRQLLEDGLDYEAARQHLLSSYLLWLETPQDRLDGKTPSQDIREERERREEEAEEE
ncbi:MAG TPA: hypothetical protein VFA07_06280 [Chthonomonadaceae bacterium]|nr:hypothetical protein [Chthonomonadaceae bacterium]